MRLLCDTKCFIFYLINLLCFIFCRTTLIKLKSRKDRAKLGQVLVEGWRLIEDGIKAKCKLTHIIFSRLEDLNNLKPHLPNTGVMIYKIPYKEIELWSDVETCPGILGKQLILRICKKKMIKCESEVCN